MATISIDGLTGSDELSVRLNCIKQKRGDASKHYEACRKLIWPHLDTHRWHDLCRDEMCRNKITVLMGPGSSGKTHEAAWFALVKYFSDPDNTCVLVSSTDIKGLKRRVWGEICMLWEQAIKRYEWLPGHLLDSAIAITTDELDDTDSDKRSVRDMRRGIVGIPTVQGGKQVGLSRWVGIKQKNVLLIADEAAHMAASFLSAFANLNNNENFTAIVIGNPADILDPLGKAAEPKEGWSSHLNPDKTSVWNTKFMNGRCVNLIGTDSPNFDFPADQPARYKYLISHEKIELSATTYTRNSVEYYSQCVGAMQIGIMARRVLNRDLCAQHHAADDLIWDGAARTKVAALDAAYGGDRAVLGHCEFGKCVDRRIRIKLFPTVVVPVLVADKSNPMDAEQQIARFCRKYCEGFDIPPENFFHDSTGRGSLGTALAREWSELCNPVEFGGSPTKRPANGTEYVTDPETGARRLKRADEHYIKLVTEYWFSFRYCVEADQIRGLVEDVMDEFCMREWKRGSGDRIELETKRDMKERVGHSPDLADQHSILIEGCRRLGFVIEALKEPWEGRRIEEDWLAREQAKFQNHRKRYELQYT